MVIFLVSSSKLVKEVYWNVIAREFLKLIYGCIYNKNKLTKEKLGAKVSLLTV